QAFGGRSRHQVDQALAARGQSRKGDVARVAAEGCDVLAHPAQRGYLVQQTRIGGSGIFGPKQGAQVEEAERTEPVVDGDDDGPAARDPGALPGHVDPGAVVKAATV